MTKRAFSGGARGGLCETDHNHLSNNFAARFNRAVFASNRAFSNKSFAISSFIFCFMGSPSD
jgi:hypothetical protein